MPQGPWFRPPSAGLDPCGATMRWVLLGTSSLIGVRPRHRARRRRVRGPEALRGTPRQHRHLGARIGTLSASAQPACIDPARGPVISTGVGLLASRSSLSRTEGNEQIWSDRARQVYVQIE